VSRAEPVVDDIELDARLVGLPIEIVAIGADRRLVTVDLTLGTLTVFAVEAQPFGRPMVYVGDDWTLIPSADAALPSTLVRGAPPTEHVDQVDVGVAADIVGVDGDVIWVAQPTATVDVSVRSIDLAAGSDEATSPDIVVPADPAGGDPAGGVVVSAPGGWYRVDDSTRERLTGGELIALGTDLMLVRDCSENLDCSLFVLDRADGRATRIEARSDSSDTRRWSIERLDGCPAQISPDGSAALVGVNDGSAPGPATVLGLFDLTTGNLSVIGETGAADQCAFTPDGRFVFFLRSGGGMFAFDRSDGDVIEVVDGRLTPEAFGVRSAGG